MELWQQRLEADVREMSSLWHSESFYFHWAEGSLEFKGKAAQEMFSINVSLLWHRKEQQRQEYGWEERAVNVK